MRISETPEAEALSSSSLSLLQVPQTYSGSRLRKNQDPELIQWDNRLAYTKEQEGVILFYHDSLGMRWENVVSEWNSLYNTETSELWDRRSLSSL